MNVSSLLPSLAGTAPEPRVLVEDQTVPDIMDAMLDKQQECATDYDRIADYFYSEEDSIEDVCRRLWQFCKDNLEYSIEKVDLQRVSSPYSILKRGHVDCKGYALFIAGVLDALKRRGMNITWVFRFASYRLFNPEPGHVFVVVNPTSDNIWVDPVLDNFNQHYFYWWKQDKRATVNAKKAGWVGCVCEMGAVGTLTAITELNNDIAAQNQPASEIVPPDSLSPAQISNNNSIISAILSDYQTMGNEMAPVNYQFYLLASMASAFGWPLYNGGGHPLDVQMVNKDGSMTYPEEWVTKFIEPNFPDLYDQYEEDWSVGIHQAIADTLQTVKNQSIKTLEMIPALVASLVTGNYAGAIKAVATGLTPVQPVTTTLKVPPVSGSAASSSVGIPNAWLWIAGGAGLLILLLYNHK